MTSSTHRLLGPASPAFADWGAPVGAPAAADGKVRPLPGLDSPDWDFSLGPDVRIFLAVAQWRADRDEDESPVAPYNDDDALIADAHSLGYEFLPARPPEGLSDLLVVSWWSAYHRGTLDAIEDSRPDREAEDERICLDDPTPNWHEDEVRASRSNGGHAFGWDAEEGEDG